MPVLKPSTAHHFTRVQTKHLCQALRKRAYQNRVVSISWQEPTATNPERSAATVALAGRCCFCSASRFCSSAFFGRRLGENLTIFRNLGFPIP